MPPEDKTDVLSWVLWGVGAIIVALSGAIGVLWKANESRNSVEINSLKQRVTELEKKLDDAIQRERKLIETIMELKRADHEEDH